MTVNCYKMRFITRMIQGGYRCWMVRVGLQTKQCRQQQFAYLKDAKIYRDSEEKRLEQVYDIRFDLHWNPKKESVNKNVIVKESGEYWNWVASVWDHKKYKQIKKSYSINKYGYRKARRLAYKWRDEKREVLYGKP